MWTAPDRQFTLMITAVFNTFKLSNGYGRPIFVQKLIDASTLLTQCKFLAKTHKIKILEGLLRIFLDVIGPSVILAKCFDSTDTHFFVYVYTFATRFFFCNLFCKSAEQRCLKNVLTSSVLLSRLDLKRGSDFTGKYGTSVFIT